MTADDAFWRRPAAETDERAADAPSAPSPVPAYSGPPPTVRPGPGDLPPPLIQQLPPPRPLPSQDYAAMDDAERQAQLVSVGVGVTFAVLVVLLVLFIAIRQLA